MKIVTCFGGIYKLSEKAYRTMLENIKNEKEFNLDKKSRFIGIVDCDVTDMEPSDAEDKLEYLKENEK